MDQKAVLDKFVKKVEKKFRPQAVLLFGSRAREDHLLQSDYDFIIVSDQFANVRWLHRILSVVKLWEADENIDVLPYTPEEFEDKRINASVVRSAMKDAKFIYGNLESTKAMKTA